jgi:hypothetical protein
MASRPDIAYAVHQCARLLASQRREHTTAVKLIGRCLLGTKNSGTEMTLRNKSFEVYSNWDLEIAEFDASTAWYRSGISILYAGCTISY